MAQDRLFHKSLGHGERVNQLSDFEYIVWGCYVLSADDYGVMRFSAVTLQSDHDRLASKNKGALERALRRCVEIGLLLAFEHQGRRYVCQADWQDYQKVRYPSNTTNPVPPEDVLAQCSQKTRELFAKHAKFAPNDLRVVSETVPEKSNPHLVLNTANANANANAVERVQGKPIDPELDPDLTSRAGAFIERYVELYAKHRHGARWMRRKPALEYSAALRLVQTFDDGRLDKLVAVFLTTDDDWVTKTDRGLLVFDAKATWCDERLAAWEAKQRQGVA